MNEENTKKLYTDFPNLYRGRSKSLKESLMPFGFMCGDGWFKLVYKLSKDITKLDPEGKVEAVEVKEKFAGLRFYIGPAIPKIHKLIQKAEDESYHICEDCGKKGKMRDDLGWYRTLCIKCYREELGELKYKINKLRGKK